MSYWLSFFALTAANNATIACTAPVNESPQTDTSNADYLHICCCCFPDVISYTIQSSH